MTFAMTKNYGKEASLNRGKASINQKQRLQAMPLPHPDHFAAGLERIVAKVVGDLERRATVNLQHLGDFIQAGMH